MNRALRILAVALTVLAAMPAEAAARTGWTPATGQGRSGAVVRELKFQDARILVTFVPGDFQLPEKDFLDWVLRSARATATFFGRFPVSSVRISLEPDSGAWVGDGVAWASPEARIRLRIGRAIKARTLKDDSTLVHEMTHLGFPDLDDIHLWLHEGIATYVETIARAQAGETTPARAWAYFAEEMPQGLPERGDKGLNDTPSIDRRYWGGAMFCLLADVEIRRRTSNRYGLKHALRAVLAAGGTLADTWEIERVLRIADRAVGVPVLSELFPTWKDRSVSPDLERLWAELGVRRAGDAVRLLDSAPLAAVRRAITEPPVRPMLLVGPTLVREADRRAAGEPEGSPRVLRKFTNDGEKRREPYPRPSEPRQ
jgi:hypothetical protein